MDKMLLLAVALLPLTSAEDDTCKPHDHPMFHWIDYIVLAAMVIISCGIGTFYAYFSQKQKTSNDFLLGGSDMATIPMAMSLAAGFITAIELLGNPAEMYIYGTQFWLTCISFILVIPITSYLYLPVYMKLRLTSCYEYLEMRFNKRTRILAAGLYVLQMVLYTSVAVYAPALALSHVTGVNTYIAVSFVYVVCIFYASQGGMKAVIMTDTFQAVVLIGSILAVLVVGTVMVGGPSYIWEQNLISDRIELFVLDPNPTIRHSVWSVVFGGTVYWATMFCANQASIQKYLSVEKISQVRRALWVSCVSLIIVFSINFFTGMIMYAEYHNCDPLRIQAITASDQLLPLYVMNSLGHLKGIPGLFVAGIFAASLGTVASAVNSLAAVTMKDFLGCMCNVTIPEHKGAMVSKWLSVMFGLISFGLIFIVERLGSVLQVALSFNGMAGGVVLGLFSLGMFFPWANSRGALFGATIALALVVWVCLCSQIALTNNFQTAVPKDTSIEGCPCNVTEVVPEEILSKDEVFVLFQISYLWYSSIGFIVTMVLGLGFSLISGPQDPCRVHPDLISPPVQALLKALPNSLKEVLSLPLESKESPENFARSKEDCTKKKEPENQNEFRLNAGIVNPALTPDNE